MITPPRRTATRRREPAYDRSVAPREPRQHNGHQAQKREEHDEQAQPRDLFNNRRPRGASTHEGKHASGTEPYRRKVDKPSADESALRKDRPDERRSVAGDQPRPAHTESDKDTRPHQSHQVCRQRQWRFANRKRYGHGVLDHIVTSSHIRLLVRATGRNETPTAMRLIAGGTARRP